MSAADIVTRLMRESEAKDAKIGRLQIALRGFEHEPVNPFPLLSSSEILTILHPQRDRGCR